VRGEHERALDAHLDASRGSSLVDQASFVVVRDAGIECAFAFDVGFVRAGFATMA
jgi:predicted nucleic acid-binding protein